ncbi:MAG: helix-turn-helix transcriptional regulator [Ruminococcus sp.]|nr:helix-turn-helix transcriptional regulator [Ruminococcus sp.]
MDQVKIGSFISERRKAAGLTQAQLAERLNITDRAVSKWENGKSMPDSSIMLELCSELHITVNDLLSGEVVTMDKHNEKTEKLLIEMAKQKEDSDKRLLSLEILIGIFSIIILLGSTMVASLFEMDAWLRILIIAAGFAVSCIGIGYALKIEQVAGYYQCAKCHHRYVPTFASVFFAMHINRTRYLKCPHCGKHSWNKKVISKE